MPRAPADDWIRKPKSPAANLQDYAAARAAFTWDAARAALDGLPDGALNIAHEAVDRHARGAGAARRALRFVEPGRRTHDLSFGELKALTDRFANLLRELGVAPGERVCTVLGPTPELFVTVLGALKHGCVACPLFTAFGPEPLATRLQRSEAAVLVTSAAIYRRKIAALRDRLPKLRHVLLTDTGGRAADAGSADFHTLLDSARPEYGTVRTSAETPALLHFTSGTTGAPKGVVHVHEAIVAQHATARLALDLRPGDVYWCTADPGWVTGSVYGILAPLAVGASVLVFQGDFDPRSWYALLEQERVNVWYTAPTAVRMLMKHGPALARGHDFGALRFLASVGEPLHAGAVHWSAQVFGRPFHDTWWQTETGAIMIANYAGMDIKPGSMGRPFPGIDAAILLRDAHGNVREAGANGVGELALRVPWPSMFRGYFADPARYRRSFVQDWYLSGDLARRDAEGYFWFVGRSDDVINTAGHLVGPFEVESALLAHPAVADAGVVGMPDPLIMETVKAFVELKPGHAPDDALRRELLAHARRLLGPGVAPRELEFRDTLPRTRSGKIMRRVLKAQELGLGAGDLSTLDTAGSEGG